METLPDLSIIALTKGMTGFILKLSPIVAIWDSFYALMTMQDTVFSLKILIMLSLGIIYPEYNLYFLPLIPLVLMVTILENLMYDRKFEEPA